MKAWRFLLVLTLVQLAQPAQAFAALIVSVSDLTLPAGGSGFVDVHIRSDSSDLLQFYSYVFHIAPVGAPGTRLEFANPQSDPQLTDPDYVFFGNSFDLSNGLPVGSVSDSSPATPGDTFDGSDLTADFMDVMLDGTDQLLARLEVTAATASPPIPGDQFTVTLLDVDSIFLTALFDPVGLNLDESDLVGTVTISEAAAVPEPASLTLFCLGALGLAAARRRCQVRRHTARPAGADRHG